MVLSATTPSGQTDSQEFVGTNLYTKEGIPPRLEREALDTSGFRSDRCGCSGDGIYGQ